ncbi:MAG: PDZ domain-containing protein [Acidobacteriia bacterium]|nr:PDZ domain-containing protein [Terriglobia bacterium]
MRLCYRLLPLSLVASLGFAQLTMDQKVSDFQALSALYAKRYGPYEWKRDAIGFDLFKIAPWLAQVQATTNDLDFYEVMSSYVSSLNDAHDVYELPTNFAANLNFGVDIYDGKLLVDFINRSRLPASEFQFVIGYELVSIDGQDANKLLDGLLKYEIAANPRSTRRLAAQLLTYRPEVLMPHAANVPEISTVVFRRPDGGQETYRIPWTKSGLSLTTVGTYTTPTSFVGHGTRGISPADNPVAPVPTDDPPDYMKVLARLQNCLLPDKAVNGFGGLTPIFVASLPSTFVQRLGKTFTDPFYSGVFTAGGFKIGFIRIPSYAPLNQTTALTAFQTEIAYFQANTDGLVVDEMRNPGGSVSYLNLIVSLLMPNTWRSIPFALRATSELVVAISSAYESAKAQGAPQSILDLLAALKTAILTANDQMRGDTVPIPLDDVTIDRSPALDSKGNVIAYTKPLMVLIDEMSASGGDAFAATIQDNARGPLFGWRTMGAGGNVEDWEAGTYSLGIASVTESLMIRKNPVVTTDYPTAPYVENIGVRPDIQVDYMTRDNLTQNGKPFVDAFVAAMVAQLQKGN